MKINKKYLPLWRDNYRYAVLSGGRGSGKSVAMQAFIRDLSYEAGHKIIATRYTMTSAEKSVVPEFSGKLNWDLSPYGGGDMSNDFDLTGRTFTNNRSLSEVTFMGLKTSSGIQTASLKSIEGITTWLLDEAEELIDDGTEVKACTFDRLDDSIRTKSSRLRTMMIWNPSHEDSFIYKRFFKEKGVDITFNGIKDDVLYIYTTYLDNLENLHQSFIEKAEQTKAANPNRYDHIYLGYPTKQNENALWKRDTMISPYRVDSSPDLRRIVVAVDPSVSEGKEENDECGIVVVGHGFDDHFYVLRDASGRMSPLDWAKTVIAQYVDFHADKIVAEVNQGFALVELNIQNVLKNAPVKSVVAKKGKMTRAEPVSALYEEGRVHHVGHFKELESQMCGYTGDPKQKSPDRMDALVYALTELAFPDEKPLYFA